MTLRGEVRCLYMYLGYLLSHCLSLLVIVTAWLTERTIHFRRYFCFTSSAMRFKPTISHKQHEYGSLAENTMVTLVTVTGA